MFQSKRRRKSLQTGPETTPPGIKEPDDVGNVVCVNCGARAGFLQFHPTYVFIAKCPLHVNRAVHSIVINQPLERTPR